MNFNDFRKFQTSSKIDGNYVGTVNENVIRIIEEKIPDYEFIIKNQNSLPYLIRSEIVKKDDNKLYVKHPYLKNITYFLEWTPTQKVEAAISILTLQNKLIHLGYYLNDPHAFNVTFQNAVPVYFDLGSIIKGKIIPAYWFVKNFLGIGSKDYWGLVLKMNKIKVFTTFLIMTIHPEPLSYLEKVVTKSFSHKGFLTNSIFNMVWRIKKIISPLHLNKQKLGSIQRFIFKHSNFVTYWTDYNQKNLEVVVEDERTKNVTYIIKQINSTKILDIGGNKGAFSKLALRLGAKEVVCIDLDSSSIDFLRADIKKNDLNIWTANMNLLDYNETPASNKNFLPAHERLQSEFCICLALIHHLCYFSDYTFSQVAFRLNRFCLKTLLIEFVPFDDSHLNGPIYNGKDKSWYTKENFILEMQKFFTGDFTIYNSSPSPRILILFNKK